MHDQTEHADGDVHGLIDFVYCQLAMNLFHSLACLLHGGKGLPVDVGGLDGVDLLLQGAYLRNGLV